MELYLDFTIADETLSIGPIVSVERAQAEYQQKITAFFADRENNTGTAHIRARDGEMVLLVVQIIRIVPWHKLLAVLAFLGANSGVKMPLTTGEVPAPAPATNLTATYDEWKKQLVVVTAAHTGLSQESVKIDDTGARHWYNSGYTPYYTFRETWDMENDASIW